MPIERVGWAVSVGGGFRREEEGVEGEMVPMRLSGERVLDIRVGEWTEL
jgi:hypothetical protein